MIPENRLSTTNLPSDLLPPRDIVYRPTLNYELGGVDISDPSQGLQVKTWTGELIGDTVFLSAEGVAPVAVVTDPGMTEFHFTFDQNMNPFVCWRAAGQSKYRWFDTTENDFVVTLLGAEDITPRCVLDDKRELQSGSSDIILAYVRAQTLYFRMQRERYLTEYTLSAGVPRLVNIGMGRNNRLQFVYRN